VSSAKQARASVGELNEGRWSVVSERGREAAGLLYADAAALVRRLFGEKIYGTCVVTDEAAARLNSGGSATQTKVAATPRDNGTPRDNNIQPTPAKRRRAPRKKRTDTEAGS
jgi:hypothetical protein